MALTRASHWSPIFLTLENKFGIKYFTWCLVWCMHGWHGQYEVTCCAQKKWVIDHDSMHAWQKFWGKRKERNTSLILIQFSLSFFQIFSSCHIILVIFYSTFFSKNSLLFLQYFQYHILFNIFLLFQTESIFIQHSRIFFEENE